MYLLIDTCISMTDTYLYVSIYTSMTTRRLTRSPDDHRQEVKDVLSAIFLKLGTINKSI